MGISLSRNTHRLRPLLRCRFSFLLHCFIVLLLLQPHAFQYRRERLLILLRRRLRWHAQERNQSLRLQHGDQPIDFLSADRRIVAQICRKPRLSIKLDPRWLPRYLQPRIGFSQFLNQRLRRVLPSASPPFCEIPPSGANATLSLSSYFFQFSGTFSAYAALW